MANSTTLVPISLLAIVLMVSCQAAPVLPAPSPGPTATPSASAATSPTPVVSSVAPSPSISLPANGRIVLNRHDTVTDMGKTYTFEADGSNERTVGGGDVSCADWSADGALLACTTWLATGGRPAFANADGSGFETIDIEAYEGRSLQCNFLDKARFVCEVHEIDGVPPPPDRGLLIVDATDGHAIKQLTLFPKNCGDTDVVAAPDSHSILFNRVCAPNDQGTLYVMRDDGTGMVRLSPPDVSAEEFYGSISADWSPDGSWICFAAFVPKADSPALYVVRPDGSELRQIVPTSVGAITAQWSPDGSLITFNSRLRSKPQIWAVRPDGTGMHMVTNGTDETTAVAPIWSPDGTRILYTRLTESGVEMWTIKRDGTDERFVTDLKNQESVSYAWGAASK